MGEPSLGRRLSELTDVLLDRAGPYLEKAAGYAAQGVAVAAGQLARATRGRYADIIHTVSGKIESALDKER